MTTRDTVGMSRESSEMLSFPDFLGSRRASGHVVCCARKGRNMWGFLPLTTLLLFSIFTATLSEEKQDVGNGAIVRARLEVCSGLHL